MEKQLLHQGFYRIKREDVLSLKKYYDKMKGAYASSVNLVSIFAWDKNLPAYYKEVSGFLCFVVYDKINFRWVCLPPIGDYERGKELKEAFSVMEIFFADMHQPLIFTDVTPWMLPRFEDFFSGRMETEDSEELREYIYSVDAFEEKLKEQRERYNYQYFLKKNHIEIKELTKEREEDCQKVLTESFCSIHSCSECEYGCLKDTLHHVLLVCGDSNIYGFLIYADQVPIAYNIVSKEKEQLVFHFKKNVRGYRGMNEYIHKETLERYGKDCITINYTEDMGVEGLRNYKRNLCSFTCQPKLEVKIK